MNAELAARIARSVVVDPITGCWDWQHARCGHRCAAGGGYGVFSFRGRRLLGHRAAWEAANGPIPAGLQVLHECDNSRCCNPGHLKLGTQLQNVADAVARDRHAAGERHAMARLNAERARLVRADSRHVDIVAAANGISRSHVYNIRNGDAWRTA